MDKLDLKGKGPEPFSLVIDERKKYFSQIVESTLGILYKSGNYEQIDAYERAVSGLSAKVNWGLRDSLPDDANHIMNNMFSKAQSKKPLLKPQRKKRPQVTGDPTPKLDYGTYLEARKSGLSDEEIAYSFRTDSKKQLSGFIGAYSRYRKKK